MKRITALILALLMLNACAEKRQNYIIGVSQCSEDAWRATEQFHPLFCAFGSLNCLRAIFTPPLFCATVFHSREHPVLKDMLEFYGAVRHKS